MLKIYACDGGVLYLQDFVALLLKLFDYILNMEILVNTIFCGNSLIKIALDEFYW